MASKLLLPVVLLLLCFRQADFRWLNDIPEPKDLIDQLRNFTALWREYETTWTWYHDKIPAEALGYRNFSCDVTADTSGIEPANVHMLRPGDIGVIGALGDSLTAANGAGGHRIIDVSLEYRGVSFAIGGDDSLEDALTLPNILRKYNPNIYGASKGASSADFEPLAQLNVAVPGSRARDMPDQAREFVSRVRKNPPIWRLWKVVTVFVGANDICQYCVENKNIRMLTEQVLVSRWIMDIERAIDILSHGLSKTFLNLVPAPPLAALRKYNDHAMCKFLHNIECPCVSTTYENYSRTDQLNRLYQSKLQELVGKYERWDFTVVVQPFSTTILVPMNTDKNESDLSYMAPDCFHFSRRSHAASAAALWNNMLQAVGEKSTTTDPSVTYLECPDKHYGCIAAVLRVAGKHLGCTKLKHFMIDYPYFRTSINSVNRSLDHVAAKLRSLQLQTPGQESANTLRLANDDPQSDSAEVGRPGPAIWIFAGLLMALVVGVVILYCTWKDRLLIEKRQRLPDENTPLIMRPMNDIS